MIVGNIASWGRLVVRLAILLSSPGGCAGTEFEPVKRTDAPDSLTVRSIVTDEFRNAKLTGNAYVSEVRETTGPEPGDWMVCFKSDEPDQAVRYAVFFRNDKAVAARPAAVIDGCNRATYSPLEPPLPHWPHR
ncbi:MAG: hypothetical protein C5B58_10185 [Acidobacteria bacterium]|nr:MAG: hypothetical protein C5B58_10185 [Acidobacteriota bacterium]